MRKRRLAAAVAALVLAIVLALLVRGKRGLDDGAVQSERDSQRALEKSVFVPSAQTPSAMTGEMDMSSPNAAVWRVFQERFGTQLEPEYAHGLIVSVHSRQGRGSPATDEFDPRDPQLAIARAREIVEALEKELGITSALPLRDPLHQGTPHAAQVHFRQVVDGIPIAPFGGVTVQLGGEGELLRLDSSVLPSLNVANKVSLSAEDARTRAMQAFLSGDAEWRAQPGVEGGNRLIWVSKPFSAVGPTEGRHAYEFTIGGDQIIIDAESGRVLLRKSQRRH
ncbi:MAG: hypothetical protein A2X94_14705 [Bdellovibrionales bacterium GWB1_55_8]|nr:MAG: hypothetical protein A2X94_14705 [Bdellovibrionales bacterium GWB1_55_8]